MPEPGFARAALPLFAEDAVDVVEWSFDMGWGPSGVPAWLSQVLDDYSEHGRLDGHGVSFSLLSQHPRQEAWLQRLDGELRRRPYRRVSEHVGFMAAGSAYRSTPLPMPNCPEVLRLGRSQLDRIAERVGSPVGLENLATSLSPHDARQQGDLIAAVLAPADGWMVLDLHNLYCQAHNFGLDVADLLGLYPLDRVRELHVSGGSWWRPRSDGRTLRRDTHDGLVPPEVMDALRLALERCPNVDTVILERIGSSFDGIDDEEFRTEFRAIRSLCAAMV